MQRNIFPILLLTTHITAMQTSGSAVCECYHHEYDTGGDYACGKPVDTCNITTTQLVTLARNNANQWHTSINGTQLQILDCCEMYMPITHSRSTDNLHTFLIARHVQAISIIHLTKIYTKFTRDMDGMQVDSVRIEFVNFDPCSDSAEIITKSAYSHRHIHIDMNGLYKK